MTQVADFTSLPVKFGEKSSVVRYLYMKRHEAVDNILKPTDRTLYIINVPSYVQQDCVKNIFDKCGDIEKVFIQSKPNSKINDGDDKSTKYFTDKSSPSGCKVVYVVFEKPSSLRKALLLKDTVQTIPSELLAPNIGKYKWCRSYNSSFIDIKEVQKEIENFMSDYDKSVAEGKRKAQELDGVTDEEGWITISKHSRKSKIPRKEAVNKKLKRFEIEKSKKTLLNFYKCQLRDSKMQHLTELSKKFEKDKERIALMKVNRKFKPF
ncbi:ribosomal RNA-processing protein 7 homolog A-like [Uloborus diversus]|uniref:ribosomal RNA-processing protein 7 homolog A-like n=1 Tax=Uloborus diversus TaxID=327109 RepID=UPI0024092847|nr:ribosomal RNA-processing protein 7 homolog A-like [Uloborus diversus]